MEQTSGLGIWAVTEQSGKEADFWKHEGRIFYTNSTQTSFPGIITIAVGNPAHNGGVETK